MDVGTEAAGQIIRISSQVTEMLIRIIIKEGLLGLGLPAIRSAFALAFAIGKRLHKMALENGGEVPFDWLDKHSTMGMGCVTIPGSQYEKLHALCKELRLPICTFDVLKDPNGALTVWYGVENTKKMEMAIKATGITSKLTDGITLDVVEPPVIKELVADRAFSHPERLKDEELGITIDRESLEIEDVENEFNVSYVPGTGRKSALKLSYEADDLEWRIGPDGERKTLEAIIRPDRTYDILDAKTYEVKETITGKELVANHYDNKTRELGGKETHEERSEPRTNVLQASLPLQLPENEEELTYIPIPGTDGQLKLNYYDLEAGSVLSLDQKGAPSSLEVRLQPNRTYALYDAKNRPMIGDYEAITGKKLADYLAQPTKPAGREGNSRSARAFVSAAKKQSEAISRGSIPVPQRVRTAEIGIGER